MRIHIKNTITKLKNEYYSVEFQPSSSFVAEALDVIEAQQAQLKVMAKNLKNSRKANSELNKAIHRVNAELFLQKQETDRQKIRADYILNDLKVEINRQ